MKLGLKKQTADMLALGLYFAGNGESRWWQHEKAYAFWDKALSIAKQKELKTAIFKRIKDAERFHKRKNTGNNQPRRSNR